MKSLVELLGMTTRDDVVAELQRRRGGGAWDWRLLSEREMAVLGLLEWHDEVRAWLPAADAASRAEELLAGSEWWFLRRRCEIRAVLGLAPVLVPHPGGFWCVSTAVTAGRCLAGGRVSCRCLEIGVEAAEVIEVDVERAAVWARRVARRAHAAWIHRSGGRERATPRRVGWGAGARAVPLRDEPLAHRARLYDGAENTGEAGLLVRGERSRSISPDALWSRRPLDDAEVEELNLRLGVAAPRSRVVNGRTSWDG